MTLSQGLVHRLHERIANSVPVPIEYSGYLHGSAVLYETNLRLHIYRSRYTLRQGASGFPRDRNSPKGYSAFLGTKERGHEVRGEGQRECTVILI